MPKTLMAAGASTVTSAAFQISVAIWPDWLHAHVLVAYALWGLSAIFWIVWLTLPDRKDNPESGNAIIAPSASVNAPITVSPVFNFGSHPETVSPVANAAERMDTNSRLAIVGLENYNVGYSFAHKWFRDSSSDTPAISLCIENRPANVGADTDPIKDLVATIRYYQPSGQLRHTISRAFWIDHSRNRIRLLSGQAAGILIGNCVGSYLHIFENPRELHYSLPRRPPERPVEPPSPRILSFSEPWEAEVIVIAGTKSVARAVLRLTPTAEGCSVLLYEKFAHGEGG